MEENNRAQKIAVADCLPGMIIADNIFSTNRILIIPAGTILDEYSIERLDNLFISHVDIYDMPAGEIETEVHSFERTYTNHVSQLKNIFTSLENGNLLRMEEIRLTVSDVITSNIGHRDILHTLNGLRNFDEYTYTHSLNVGILAMMLARWSGIPEDQTKQICYAGVLHDIGKARIPGSILNKPGPLTAEEFSVIKGHSVAGYDILKFNHNISDDIRQGVLTHHERIDGSGYPFGIAGNRIHEYGKIIAVADVFDAMVSDRCYKTKECPLHVLEHFETQCLGHLDSKYLKTFIEKISFYFLGEHVQLSDGRLAEVVFVNPRHLNRPIVQVDGVIIDLAKVLSLSISGLSERATA